VSCWVELVSPLCVNDAWRGQSPTPVFTHCLSLPSVAFKQSIKVPSLISLAVSYPILVVSYPILACLFHLQLVGRGQCPRTLVQQNKLEATHVGADVAYCVLAGSATSSRGGKEGVRTLDCGGIHWSHLRICAPGR
jgi:hypothetical protein